jgi:hypothetical protein
MNATIGSSPVVPRRNSTVTPVQATHEKFVSVAAMGRFGNHLFILASAHGIARRRGAKVCLANKKDLLVEQHSITAHGNSNILWVLNSTSFFGSDIGCPPGKHSRSSWSEQGRFERFDPSVFAVKGDWLSLDGNYLQSYKYFSEDGSLPFEFPGRKWGSKQLKEVYDGATCGVHVRRGDYVNNPSRRVPPLSYYAEALRRLRQEVPGVQCVIASDDPQWVAAQEPFQGLRILQGTPQQDLAVLACTQHMILSVGTYGWWAAWLREAPGHTYYFSVGSDLQDHFPPAWIGIPE